MFYRLFVETLQLFMFRIIRRPMPFHIYTVYHHDNNYENRTDVTENFYNNKLLNVDKNSFFEYRMTDNKSNKHIVIEKANRGMISNIFTHESFVERVINANLVYTDEFLDITPHFSKYLGPNGNFFNNTELSPEMICKGYDKENLESLRLLTSH